jgi:lysophospholipase L1-like esterase
MTLKMAGRIAALICLGGLLLRYESGIVRAQESESAAGTCLHANREISLGVRLSRTAARLKSGGPLTIVAIGSSSTTGLWVFNPAATFPQVMRRELTSLQPKVPINVVNSGRVGDTVVGSIRRFARDVLAYHPDLIVWQLGTNDVVGGGNPMGLQESIITGVRMLKEHHADLILMDLQYTPVVLASPGHSSMQAIIAAVAKTEGVGLFSRYALMRQSTDAGVRPQALVSWDGLHNSAAGYECIGRALAKAINAAAH